VPAGADLPGHVRPSCQKAPSFFRNQGRVLSLNMRDTNEEEIAVMVDENRVQGAFDKAKGAVKEGIGNLTGDEKLKAEGRADKAKGHVESAVGGAKDAVKDAVNKI